LAQGCLLAIAPLKRNLQWVFVATVAAILSLAGLVSGMIVFEAEEEWLFRLAGVLGILDGCGSLTIPVLSKLGQKTGRQPEGDLPAQIELRCPRCRHRGVYSIGDVVCRECSLGMRIELLSEQFDRDP